MWMKGKILVGSHQKAISWCQAAGIQDLWVQTQLGEISYLYFGTIHPPISEGNLPIHDFFLEDTLISILESFLSANIPMSSAANDQRLNPSLKLFLGNRVFFAQGHSTPGSPSLDNDWLMDAYKVPVSCCSWGQLWMARCSLKCNHILGQFTCPYKWISLWINILHALSVLNYCFRGKQFKAL